MFIIFEYYNRNIPLDLLEIYVSTDLLQWRYFGYFWVSLNSTIFCENVLETLGDIMANIEVGKSEGSKLIQDFRQKYPK
jgi:hypothetical protein